MVNIFMLKIFFEKLKEEIFRVHFLFFSKLFGNIGEISWLFGNIDEIS